MLKHIFNHIFILFHIQYVSHQSTYMDIWWLSFIGSYWICNLWNCGQQKKFGNNRIGIFTNNRAPVWVQPVERKHTLDMAFEPGARHLWFELSSGEVLKQYEVSQSRWRCWCNDFKATMFRSLALVYPLVNSHIANWKDPPCFSYGKIHYFDWAMFNSYVKLPEGMFLIMKNSLAFSQHR